MWHNGRLQKPWILPEILDYDVSSPVSNKEPRFLQIVKKEEGPCPDGSIVVLVTDGKWDIKAVLTQEALKEFQEEERYSEEYFHCSKIIARKYHFSVVYSDIKENSEFFLVVTELKFWTCLPGHYRKNPGILCNTVPEVRQKLEKGWIQWKANRSEKTRQCWNEENAALSELMGQFTQPGSQRLLTQCGLSQLTQSWTMPSQLTQCREAKQSNLSRDAPIPHIEEPESDATITDPKNGLGRKPDDHIHHTVTSGPLGVTLDPGMTLGAGDGHHSQELPVQLTSDFNIHYYLAAEPVFQLLETVKKNLSSNLVAVPPDSGITPLGSEEAPNIPLDIGDAPVNTGDVPQGSSIVQSGSENVLVVQKESRLQSKFVTSDLGVTLDPGVTLGAGDGHHSQELPVQLTSDFNIHYFLAAEPVFQNLKTVDKKSSSGQVVASLDSEIISLGSEHVLDAPQGSSNVQSGSENVPVVQEESGLQSKDVLPLNPAEHEKSSLAAVSTPDLPVQLNSVFSMGEFIISEAGQACLDRLKEWQPGFHPRTSPSHHTTSASSPLRGVQIEGAVSEPPDVTEDGERPEAQSDQGGAQDVGDGVCRKRKAGCQDESPDEDDTGGNRLKKKGRMTSGIELEEKLSTDGADVAIVSNQHEALKKKCLDDGEREMHIIQTSHIGDGQEQSPEAMLGADVGEYMDKVVFSFEGHPSQDPSPQDIGQGQGEKGQGQGEVGQGQGEEGQGQEMRDQVMNEKELHDETVVYQSTLLYGDTDETRPHFLPSPLRVSDDEEAKRLNDMLHSAEYSGERLFSSDDSEAEAQSHSHDGKSQRLVGQKYIVISSGSEEENHGSPLLRNNEEEEEEENRLEKLRTPGTLSVGPQVETSGVLVVEGNISNRAEALMAQCHTETSQVPVKPSQTESQSQTKSSRDPSQVYPSAIPTQTEAQGAPSQRQKKGVAGMLKYRDPSALYNTKTKHENKGKKKGRKLFTMDPGPLMGDDDKHVEMSSSKEIQAGTIPKSLLGRAQLLSQNNLPPGNRNVSENPPITSGRGTHGSGEQFVNSTGNSSCAILGQTSCNGVSVLEGKENNSEYIIDDTNNSVVFVEDAHTTRSQTLKSTGISSCTDVDSVHSNSMNRVVDSTVSDTQFDDFNTNFVRRHLSCKASTPVKSLPDQQQQDDVVHTSEHSEDNDVILIGEYSPEFVGALQKEYHHLPKSTFDSVQLNELKSKSDSEQDPLVQSTSDTNDNVTSAVVTVGEYIKRKRDELHSKQRSEQQKMDSMQEGDESSLEFGQRLVSSAEMTETRSNESQTQKVSQHSKTSY
ncbi:uncharacterized protein LOC106157929 isoform X2 [Lingula anatina]|uniref:Uncharacterized protein LOC106157929 isoform X2 n=1 Tax=Lingula anatina TaxID=7574 RepID=A0A1S3HVU4_LINAN|nr:uncharacterized protein LOC106157929 isoform X2 [Lingula anatina]|eukprot:XP_013389184.1 uncharacterized protein LOC106157929 isoform X2 [Lingula anatina]